MRKEEIKIVKKVWGKEIWLVNNELYCAKLLSIDPGAKTSVHCHHKKQETFYGLEGAVALIIEGKTYDLNPNARPKTILPGEFHQFVSMAERADGDEAWAIILEVSTHHDDSDVERRTESVAGEKDDPTS